MRELLRQLCLDHPGASSAACATAVEAIVQLDGIEPAIHNALEHLPNWFKQPNPPVVPPALWYQNNYAPKHLAGDDATRPDHLDQLDEELPIISIPHNIPLTLRVLLLHCARAAAAVASRRPTSGPHGAVASQQQQVPRRQAHVHHALRSGQRRRRRGRGIRLAWRNF